MKKTTSKTIIKQGENTYQPIEIDGVIYWVDFNQKIDSGYYIAIDNSICKHDSAYFRLDNDKKIVAQSQPKLEGIPVISLDSYVEKLAKEHFFQEYSWNNVNTLPYQSTQIKNIKQNFIKGYNSNPNKWTDAEVLKAIELAKEQPYFDKNGNLLLGEGHYLSTEEILEQISQIEVIHIDSQFNILSYE